MFSVLVALGIILIGWGGGVLVTGEYVATLDIAAGLVGTGVVVIALAAIVRTLDQLRRLVPSAIGSAPPLVSTTEISIDPLVSLTTNRDLPVASFDVAPVPTAAPAVERTVVAPKAAVGNAAAPAFPELPSMVAEEAKSEVTAPTLVREGVIDGRSYRFYSDGSIEAELPEGVRRYVSIDEAREDILKARREQASPRPPSLRQAEKAPAERRSAAWDDYLAAGRPAPDEKRAVAPEVSPPSSDGPAAGESAAPPVNPPTSGNVPSGALSPEVAIRPEGQAGEQKWSSSFRQLIKKTGVEPHKISDPGDRES